VVEEVVEEHAASQTFDAGIPSLMDSQKRISAVNALTVVVSAWISEKYWMQILWK